MRWRFRYREVYAEARNHCSELVHHDLAAFDLLDVSDHARQQRLRRQVMYASIRYRHASSLPDRVAEKTIQGVWRVPFLLSLAALLIIRWREEWFAYQIPLFLLGAVVLVAIFRTTLAFFNMYEQQRVGASVTVFVTAGVPLVSFIITLSEPPFLSHHPLWWSFLAGWDAACLVMLTMQTIIAVASIKGRRTMHERCRPLDNLALNTLSLAATIRRTRHRWYSAPVVRSWCLELESIAIHAESALTRPKASPIQSWQLRKSLQEEAWRIAAVFRNYQRGLLTASSNEDIDRVIASLTAGIEAMLDGDRSALLMNAPESVSRVSLVRQAFARLKPGLLLITAGIILPKIPGIPHGTGHSLQIFLIGVGVVQLLTVQADVVNRVSGALDKSLTWK